MKRNNEKVRVRGYVRYKKADTSFSISIGSWIYKLSQRSLLKWLGCLVFACVIQLFMLIIIHISHHQNIVAVKEYLEKGTGRIEDVFEMQSDLSHDKYMYSLKEYIKNNSDNLIPHKHEWVYVSSHYRDMYHHSKLGNLPLRSLHMTNIKTNVKCTNNIAHNFRDLILCNSRTTNPFLVVSTIIHPRKDKKLIYRNSINMWSDFDPNDVLPVMFISNLEEFKNDLYILKYACSKGWMVMLAPTCNENGVPILRDMVHSLVLQFPNVQWHGYVDSDMLFDKTLISTLKFLTVSSTYTPISIAVGRRYTIQIPKDRELKGHDQYENMFFDSSPSLEDVSFTDYFFTQIGKYDWSKVPPFIIGRGFFDSWLIHDSIVTNRKIIDITETIRAGHQYSMEQNQYIREPESDPDYNYNILKENNINVTLSICFTTCTPLKTMLVEQKQIRQYKRTIKDQIHWVIQNMKDAWAETDTLNKVGDPYYPRENTIPHDTSVYVEAIATRYGVYEENEVWRMKKELFRKYALLGIKPNKKRFLQICRSLGANKRRQLTLLNIVNRITATEWRLWFKK